MSTTALKTRPPRSPNPRRISVSVVRDALRAVVADYPSQIDSRIEDGLAPRYIDVTRGMPNCLVAMVLEKLGYSRGVLKALDAEHATGNLIHAGVRIEESRHPALHKLDPLARQLLAYVQRQQDSGRRWGEIVAEALRPGLLPWDRRRKPWLHQPTS